MVKGWEQVAAVLGVLRAGAAYCPVDASLPAARIRQLLGQLRAGAVLTQSCVRSVPRPAPGVPVLAVDRLTLRSDQFTPHGGGPDELAYVIFTSGPPARPRE